MCQSINVNQKTMPLVIHKFVALYNFTRIPESPIQLLYFHFGFSLCGGCHSGVIRMIGLRQMLFQAQPGFEPCSSYIRGVKLQSSGASVLQILDVSLLHLNQMC